MFVFNNKYRKFLKYNKIFRKFNILVTAVRNLKVIFQEKVHLVHL